MSSSGGPSLISFAGDNNSHYGLHSNSDNDNMGLNGESSSIGNKTMKSSTVALKIKPAS